MNGVLVPGLTHQHSPTSAASSVLNATHVFDPVTGIALPGHGAQMYTPLLAHHQHNVAAHPHQLVHGANALPMHAFHNAQAYQQQAFALPGAVHQQHAHMSYAHMNGFHHAHSPSHAAHAHMQHHHHLHADQQQQQPAIAAHHLGTTPPVSVDAPTEAEVRSSAHLDRVMSTEFEALVEGTEQLAKRGVVLAELNELCQSWVNSNLQRQGLGHLVAEGRPAAKLFTFGSWRLGVHCTGADLDVLLIGPSAVTREMFFKELCALLAERDDVEYVSRLENAYVPLAKFSLKSIDVDLVYARLALHVIPEGVDIFDDAILEGVDHQSVLSLNGVRNTDLVLKLVPNAQVFQKALRVVRLWAKRRGIFSNVLGYPGGIAWAILVARICQLYPRATHSTIVTNFFRFYQIWRWPTPIMLQHMAEKRHGFLAWDPKRAHDKMPVITPAFPAMNSTHSVCASTLRVMEAELSRASNILAEAAREAEERKRRYEEDPTPKIVSKGQERESTAPSSSSGHDKGSELENGSAKEDRGENTNGENAATTKGERGPDGSISEATWLDLLADKRFFEDHANYLQLVAFSSSANDQRVWVGWVQSKLRHLILRLESARFLHATPFPVHHLARASVDGNATGSEEEGSVAEGGKNSKGSSESNPDVESPNLTQRRRRKRGRLSLEHNGAELNLSSASSVDAAKQVVDSMIEPGGANGSGRVANGSGSGRATNGSGSGGRSHAKDSKDVLRWKELLRDQRGAMSGEKRKRSESIDSASSLASEGGAPAAATKRPKREFSQSFWIGLDVQLGDGEKSSNAPLSVDITTAVKQFFRVVHDYHEYRQGMGVELFHHRSSELPPDVPKSAIPWLRTRSRQLSQNSAASPESREPANSASSSIVASPASSRLPSISRSPSRSGSPSPEPLCADSPDVNMTTCETSTTVDIAAESMLDNVAQSDTSDTVPSGGSQDLADQPSGEGEDPEASCDVTPSPANCLPLDAAPSISSTSEPVFTSKLPTNHDSKALPSEIVQDSVSSPKPSVDGDHLPKTEETEERAPCSEAPPTKVEDEKPRRSSRSRRHSESKSRSSRRRHSSHRSSRKRHRSKRPSDHNSETGEASQGTKAEKSAPDGGLGGDETCGESPLKKLKGGSESSSATNNVVIAEPSRTTSDSDSHECTTASKSQSASCESESNSVPSHRKTRRRHSKSGGDSRESGNKEEAKSQDKDRSKHSKHGRHKSRSKSGTGSKKRRQSASSSKRSSKSRSEKSSEETNEEPIPEGNDSENRERDLNSDVPTDCELGGETPPLLNSAGAAHRSSVSPSPSPPPPAVLTLSNVTQRRGRGIASSRHGKPMDDAFDEDMRSGRSGSSGRHSRSRSRERNSYRRYVSSSSRSRRSSQRSRDTTRSPDVKSPNVDTSLARAYAQDLQGVPYSRHRSYMREHGRREPGADARSSHDVHYRAPELSASRDAHDRAPESPTSRSSASRSAKRVSRDERRHRASMPSSMRSSIHRLYSDRVAHHSRSDRNRGSAASASLYPPLPFAFARGRGVTTHRYANATSRQLAEEAFFENAAAGRSNSHFEQEEGAPKSESQLKAMWPWARGMHEGPLNADLSSAPRPTSWEFEHLFGLRDTGGGRRDTGDKDAGEEREGGHW